MNPQSGEKFTSLTVIDCYYDLYLGKRRMFVSTKCDCGKLYNTVLSNVTGGIVKSCGCHIYKNDPNYKPGRGVVIPSKQTYVNELLLECSDSWAYPGMPDWYYAKHRKTMRNSTTTLLNIRP